MKTITIICFIVLIFCRTTFAQQFPCPLPDPILRYDVPSTGNYSNVEMRIYNQITYFNNNISNDIKVKIIPVGTFYNSVKNYSPKSIGIFGQNIAGKEIIIPYQISSSSLSYKSGNWDYSGGSSNESAFSYGFGKYKFEFYEEDTSSNWVLQNYVYIDF
ncbi:MAG TPA: hypothetical protein PKA90_09340 [Ignavibacteria bacterium]|nr:hypothetical protein [Ignavibacteria bacterium]HMR40619.1 hypothetical protein [Ignavibacteria bacterium]